MKAKMERNTLLDKPIHLSMTSETRRLIFFWQPPHPAIINQKTVNITSSRAPRNDFQSATAYERPIEWVGTQSGAQLFLARRRKLVCTSSTLRRLWKVIPRVYRATGHSSSRKTKYQDEKKKDQAPRTNRTIFNKLVLACILIFIVFAGGYHKIPAPVYLYSRTYLRSSYTMILNGYTILFDRLLVFCK